VNSVTNIAIKILKIIQLGYTKHVGWTNLDYYSIHILQIFCSVRLPKLWKSVDMCQSYERRQTGPFWDSHNASSRMDPIFESDRYYFRGVWTPVYVLRCCIAGKCARLMFTDFILLLFSKTTVILS